MPTTAFYNEEFIGLDECDASLDNAMMLYTEIGALQQIECNVSPRVNTNVTSNPVSPESIPLTHLAAIPVATKRKTEWCMRLFTTWLADWRSLLLVT